MFRDGAFAAKDKIVAGVNLKIIKEGARVVGFRIFCHKSANSAALNFCRTAADLIHKRQIIVSVVKSGKTLYFCCLHNVAQNSLKISLDDWQAGQTLRDILAEAFGSPVIEEIHDKRICGFEIKIPANS